MYFDDSLPFVSSYINSLNSDLKDSGHAPLSNKQLKWLEHCMMGVLSSKQLNWSANERNSLGSYSHRAQSWMFRQSKLDWDALWHSSIRQTLSEFTISKGSLVLDETDRARSKKTKELYQVHTMRDKRSSGHISGQCIVMLMLVSPQMSIPVGFDFYMPDPERTLWYQQDRKLRGQGIPAKQRPKKPERSDAFPSKQEIALSLLRSFKKNFSEIHVSSVNADALYGTDHFLSEAESLYDQVVSQVKGNQKIRIRGKEKSLDEYFKTSHPVASEVPVRGWKKQTIVMSSARLYLCAHGKKRFLIALKYEGEENFRYVVATNLTWRTHDILQSFFLRWIIEVFFEDWKGHQGWGQFAKHTGEDGSRRGLILSLMFDSCLFHFEDLKTSIKQGKAAYTVASVTNKARANAMVAFIQKLLGQNNKNQKIEELSNAVAKVFELKTSKKHLSGTTIPELGPTPSLKYKMTA